ncbi:hypothetical protein [Microcella sp.]|uniref:hypothetical protein n=1 Tax=Microcella sp. TaxID=1913979 RepID=UPI002562F7BD|nr:hypothetical protein [Microcella sp.]MBX9471284.1 hypothetical protein [Microcella sp.]
MSATITPVVSPAGIAAMKQLDRTDPVPSLKRAAILGERIFLHTVGLGPPNGDWYRFFVQSAFGGDKESHDLMDDPDFRSLLLLPEDYGSNTEKEMFEAPLGGFGDIAFDEIRKRAESDPQFSTGLGPAGRGTTAKDWMKLAVEISATLQMPAHLDRWLTNPVGLIGPTHVEVLQRAEVEQRSPFGPSEVLGSMGMVDFGSFSWREILQLRKSQGIYEFRLFIEGLPRDERSHVQDHLWDAVADFVSTHKPRPVRSFLKGIVASLPIPGLELIGTAQTFSDYFRQDEDLRKSRWLHFLADARRLQSTRID